MKQIREFMDQTEGLIAKDFLEANGIPSDLQGAKDYSTHVVGGTQGRYFLSVQPEDAERAHELLTKSQVKVVEQIESPTEIPEVALKKAVMYAFIAIVLLPLLGNWISVREAVKYARLAPNSNRKWIWLTVISWLQVPGLIIAWILIKSLLDSTKTLEISG